MCAEIRGEYEKHRIRYVHKPQDKIRLNTRSTLNSAARINRNSYLQDKTQFERLQVEIRTQNVKQCTSCLYRLNRINPMRPNVH